MKGRLYTASAIDELASYAGQRALILTKEDRISPLALDRARELGIEVVFGDGDDSGVPTWSGAALQMRRKRDGHAAHSPHPPSVPTPSADPPADLEALVRQAVAAVLGQTTPAGSAPGVVHISGDSVILPPCHCANAGPEMDVRRQEVITPAQGAPLTAGFMSLRRGQFPRSLGQAEIEYVIEGELQIGSDRGMVVGRPGDVIYVPKGAEITCGTSEWTRFFYVTFPDPRAQA